MLAVWGAVTPGSLCLGFGGKQQGQVTLAPGGASAVTGTGITGTVSSSEALAVTVCRSTLNAPLTVQQISGYVLIGTAPR